VFAALNKNSPKDLTTIIFASAKIAKNVSQACKQNRLNVYRKAFGSILLNQYHNPNKDIFHRLVESADCIIAKSMPRCLSNLAYAFALVGYNPKLRNDTLLEKVADASIICSKQFEAQSVSNMVWAYSTLEMPQPKLFHALGDADSMLTDHKLLQILSGGIRNIWCKAH
jgi:hypothetical protein